VDKVNDKKKEIQERCLKILEKYKYKMDEKTILNHTKNYLPKYTLGVL